MMRMRWGWMTAVLGFSVLLIAASPAASPEKSAPWIIILHGKLLAERIEIADWDDNLQVLASTNASRVVDPVDLPQRPFVDLALFWGSSWATYPRTPEALARLRPREANQHGRFYPAQNGSDPLLVVGPTSGRAYTTLGPVSPDGLAVLERHGVASELIQ